MRLADLRRCAQGRGLAAGRIEDLRSALTGEEDGAVVQQRGGGAGEVRRDLRVEVEGAVRGDGEALGRGDEVEGQLGESFRDDVEGL